MHEYRFHEDDKYILEYLKKHGIKIMIDECLSNKNPEFISVWGTEDYWDTFQRYPYFQMRGKKVTPEQAMEIISKTDYFFRNVNDENSFSCWNFPNDWFESYRKCGWAHPNGIIGTNYCMGRLPDSWDFVGYLPHLIEMFPYLDFIIAISTWSNLPPQEFDKLFDGIVIYDEYKEFYDNIDAGIWVHDKTIEFIGPQKTLEIYKKYNSLYGEKDEKIYCRDYYFECQPDIVTLDYLKRCLKEYWNIEDPDLFFAEKNLHNKIKHLK